MTELRLLPNVNENSKHYLILKMYIDYDNWSHNSVTCLIASYGELFKGDLIALAALCHKNFLCQ